MKHRLSAEDRAKGRRRQTVERFRPWLERRQAQLDAAHTAAIRRVLAGMAPDEVAALPTPTLQHMLRWLEEHP